MSLAEEVDGRGARCGERAIIGRQGVKIHRRFWVVVSLYGQAIGDVELHRLAVAEGAWLASLQIAAEPPVPDPAADLQDYSCNGFSRPRVQRDAKNRSLPQVRVARHAGALAMTRPCSKIGSSGSTRMSCARRTMEKTL